MWLSRKAYMARENRPLPLQLFDALMKGAGWLIDRYLMTLLVYLAIVPIMASFVLMGCCNLWKNGLAAYGHFGVEGTVVSVYESASFDKCEAKFRVTATGFIADDNYPLHVDGPCSAAEGRQARLVVGGSPILGSPEDELWTRGSTDWLHYRSLNYIFSGLLVLGALILVIAWNVRLDPEYQPGIVCWPRFFWYAAKAPLAAWRRQGYARYFRKETRPGPGRRRRL